MSAAWVSHQTGQVANLDGGAPPVVNVSEHDASDASWLARSLTRLLRDVAELRRSYTSRRITYRDIIVSGNAITPHRVALTHRFGQLVEFWPVRAVGFGSGMPPIEEVSQTADVLTLNVYATGKLWIRVEGAG